MPPPLSPLPLPPLRVTKANYAIVHTARGRISRTPNCECQILYDGRKKHYRRHSERPHLQIVNAKFCTMEERKTFSWKSLQIRSPFSRGTSCGNLERRMHLQQQQQQKLLLTLKNLSSLIWILPLQMLGLVLRMGKDISIQI